MSNRFLKSLLVIPALDKRLFYHYTFFITFLFLVLLLSKVNAQTSLSGTVKKSSDGKGVFGVNVLVKNPLNQTTLSFGVTDDTGFFSVQLQSEQDSLVVLFRSLTTQDYQITIFNKSQKLEVELQEAFQEIPEFTIKSIKNPISFKNDTLSYSVESFMNQNDRVIADILRKLPGIEVLENGRILYEGKGIQKFYIDGMDLLEGKYNLASNNLPADAVESIQVLENHQPLRVLDSLVFSDRASLNLKLKRKNVWVGTGNLGMGAAPIMYEGKLSPMTFRENLQMLFSAQSNTSGKDIGKELTVLTLEDLQENITKQSDFKPWFGLIPMWVPSINHERFLFNQSNLFSVNILNRNKEGADFRANISFFHDNNRQQGGINTSYFLPNDTLKINELHQNRFFTRALDADISWIKNEKKSYLKNSLNINVLNNSELGASFLNATDWNQIVDLPLASISNSFHTLRPIGKQLVNIKSDVSFKQTNQNFEVSPGSFREQLNDNLPYERLNQGLDYQSFFANQSLGITKGLRKSWSFAGDLGFLFERNMMQSDLNTMVDTPEQLVPDVFRNDLSFRQLKTYVNSQFNLKQDNFNLQFKLPLSYLDIHVNDELLAQQSKFSRILIEPQLFMRFFLSGKWNTTARISRTNDFKGIHDIHYGFILRNFRTFQQRATLVPEVLSHKLSYAINYRDPINSIFSSLTYNFSHHEMNTIMDSEVAPSGEVFYQSLDRKNIATNHLLNVRVSKYFPLFKTNLTWNGNVQHRENEQIINRELADIRYNLLGTGLELQVRPIKIANFSNKTSVNLINSEIGERNTGRIQQLTNLSSLDVFITESQTISLKWEHYDNRLSNSRDVTGFLDMSYRFKLENKKWDISLQGQNLLNSTNFETFTADSFFIRQQNFLLRPRQVLLFVNFSF
ncbi:carboxypeptidase regulatory-like domain-containing protein [Mongoliitalea lutea]|uniref:CarboxypepD_reg-like domain-containing protein n=1 Tax=Mongoliitalea lutea TaxID=849756 RepID=A0A8J3D0V1_9BACT|nr:carboxypeptidase regulatory-like domain-containing protein [Mongoliitalea lutea]GHB49318.1 hypothetical protein GCM10008106_32660 [Mongoliitalea lutea]